jgi:hypothetical protein
VCFLFPRIRGDEPGGTRSGAPGSRATVGDARVLRIPHGVVHGDDGGPGVQAVWRPLSIRAMKKRKNGGTLGHHKDPVSLEFLVSTSCAFFVFISGELRR